VSSRRTRITKDSESSAKWALSRCIGCTGEDITAGCSVRKHSTRRALRQCADRHRIKELFEFCNLKKSPLKDLCRVAEHPERLSKRLLEQKNSQEGITFSNRRRKEKELFP
jgi:hypothetical protein